MDSIIWQTKLSLKMIQPTIMNFEYIEYKIYLSIGFLKAFTKISLYKIFFRFAFLVTTLFICGFTYAQDEKLIIEGAVVLSNNDDPNPVAGTIRWTGDDFEGFDGTALMMTVPRTILFEISGTIDLQSRIQLNAENSFFTLAGQTAPGDGIAIRNHSLDFSNVQHGIVRYLRIRHGCPEGCDISVADNIRIFGGSSNIILDHLSMSWWEDECVNIVGHNIHDITLQWSIIAEGNVLCIEGNSHNLGSILGGTDHSRITIANNYIAHTCYRNHMQLIGQYEYINGLNYNTSALDFNFSQQSAEAAFEPMRADIIGYYFKEGPQTQPHYLFDLIRYSMPDDTDIYLPISLYFNDITATKSDGSDHILTGDGNPANFVRTRTLGGTTILPTWQQRFTPLIDKARFPVTIVPSIDVPAKVLPSVGASLPRRDAVDERIVNDFYTLGIWDAANIKQYPILNTYGVKLDSDNDGMPDDWETSNGLNPLDPGDHNGDINNDGYTNIENYINSI